LNEELREEFLTQSNWSALEWDKKQNRIVIIHNQMPTSEVVNAYLYPLPSSDGDEDVARRAKTELVVQETSRTAAFERLVHDNPQAGFEKIMELSTPVPAIVYLAPERPDEDNEGIEEDEE
jgi:hypothetical protein